MEFPVGSDDKESACSAGDVSSISGEGNCDPLHYFCLGNFIDRGAWVAIMHGVAKELDKT